MLRPIVVMDEKEVMVASPKLGQALMTARTMKGLSLKAVADPAEISATYLQKLERGEVQDPSPHVLYRLSKQLGLEYAQLMRLAGYVVPASTTRSLAAAAKTGPITHALSSEQLTEEEARDLAEYLAFIRQRSRGRSDAPAA
jgi:HTH-type transcriptional regulator, competence development regulator